MNAQLEKHAKTQRIFSYGTLQTEEVQITTFGRRLEGTPDALVGYRVVMVRISDAAFISKSGSAEQRSLLFTGQSSDIVQGTVFKISAKELEQADAYEPDGYERVLVQLRSGIRAWVYLTHKETKSE